jgi:hypothetical protein
MLVARLMLGEPVDDVTPRSQPLASSAGWGTTRAENAGPLRNRRVTRNRVSGPCGNGCRDLVCFS